MNTDQPVSEGTMEKPPQNAARRGPRWTALLAVFAFAIILGFFILSGIRGRMEAQTRLKEETQKSAALTVSVIHPKAQAPSQEITLPGNVQPYTETPIFARTSGYLKKWYFDLGAHVKEGDL